MQNTQRKLRKPTYYSDIDGYRWEWYKWTVYVYYSFEYEELIVHFDQGKTKDNYRVWKQAVLFKVWNPYVSNRVRMDQEILLAMVKKYGKHKVSKYIFERSLESGESKWKRKKFARLAIPYYGIILESGLLKEFPIDV